MEKNFIVVGVITAVFAVSTGVYIWINNRWIKPWVKRKQSEGVRRPDER